MRSNGHQVDRAVARQGRSEVELESVGSGLYPVLPLLNHSCDNNTLRVFTNNRVLLIAARLDHPPISSNLLLWVFLAFHCFGGILFQSP